MGSDAMILVFWMLSFKPTFPLSYFAFIKRLFSSSLLSFFFFFFFLFFTLQYCIGFAIHWHESSTGVHEFPILKPLPPPTPYHLSVSSPCTSPKHPVSCIEHRLAIRFLHYGIHVSMAVRFLTARPPREAPTEVFQGSEWHILIYN